MPISVCRDTHFASNCLHIIGSPNRGEKNLLSVVMTYQYPSIHQNKSSLWTSLQLVDGYPLCPKGSIDKISFIVYAPCSWNDLLDMIQLDSLSSMDGSFENDHCHYFWLLSSAWIYTTFLVTAVTAFSFWLKACKLFIGSPLSVVNLFLLLWCK